MSRHQHSLFLLSLWIITSYWHSREHLDDFGQLLLSVWMDSIEASRRIFFRVWQQVACRSYNNALDDKHAAFSHALTTSVRGVLWLNYRTCGRKTNWKLRELGVFEGMTRERNKPNQALAKDSSCGLLGLCKAFRDLESLSLARSGSVYLGLIRKLFRSSSVPLET